MKAIVDSCRTGWLRGTQDLGRPVAIGLAVCLLALVSYSLACMLPASIHGRVTDASTGNPLQQAPVDCWPTPGAGVTDNNGDYVSSDLSPGDCTPRRATLRTAGGLVTRVHAVPVCRRPPAQRPDSRRRRNDSESQSARPQPECPQSRRGSSSRVPDCRAQSGRRFHPATEARTESGAHGQLA